MNINTAKNQVKNAVTAYLTKDKNNQYLISVEKQRPIFLVGPPGIGKTQIMEQVAQEMGIGLLSYSMTHHTRQSALGLPFIEHKVYGNLEYDVSEYTMSEIIASIYEMMEETGIKEGILFLDEINCISETLSPIMLQFLQYKVFGKHRVPDGWVIVTAGNPPEYNNSVHEFDVVTMDRLKMVKVEADFAAWKQYAYMTQVHPSITGYLENRSDEFYRVETTVDGKQYVTARGWDDLSTMIQIYEMNGIEVDKDLVYQYITIPKIAENYFIYYKLFNKYKSNYQIEDILKGNYTNDVLLKCKKAPFDERITVTGLLISNLENKCHEFMADYNAQKQVQKVVKRIASSNQSLKEELENAVDTNNKAIEKALKSHSKSKDDIEVMRLENELLLEMAAKKWNKSWKKDVETYLKDKLKALKERRDTLQKYLNNAFHFLELAFVSDKNTMLIFMTNIMYSKSVSIFINLFGCDEYFKRNGSLKLSIRRDGILEEIDSIGSLS